MINFDEATAENVKEQNKNWSQILDLSCRILIMEALDQEK